MHSILTNNLTIAKNQVNFGQNSSEEITEASESLEIKELKAELQRLQAEKTNKENQDNYDKNTLKSAGEGALFNVFVNMITAQKTTLGNSVSSAATFAGIDNFFRAYGQHKLNKKQGLEDDPTTKKVINLSKIGAAVGGMATAVVIGLKLHARNVPLNTIGQQAKAAGIMIGSALFGAISAAATLVGYTSLFRAGSNLVDKQFDSHK